MMILQMANGTVDPNWLFGGIIVLLLMIIGGMLKATLGGISSMLSKHEERLQNHETRITVIEKTES